MLRKEIFTFRKCLTECTCNRLTISAVYALLDWFISISRVVVFDVVPCFGVVCHGVTVLLQILCVGSLVGYAYTCIASLGWGWGPVFDFYMTFFRAHLHMGLFGSKIFKNARLLLKNRRWKFSNFSWIFFPMVFTKSTYGIFKMLKLKF